MFQTMFDSLEIITYCLNIPITIILIYILSKVFKLTTRIVQRNKKLFSRILKLNYTRKIFCIIRIASFIIGNEKNECLIISNTYFKRCFKY